MLCKLALRNVRRQVGNYLIYFVTVSFTVAMFFAVSNMIFSENLRRFTVSSEDTEITLTILVILISLVVAFVLSYATSFLMKLRKREFGMYLTLGMTRRNITAIFLSETAIIGLLALGMGLAFGLFFYQGLSALLMSLLEMEFTLAAYAPKGLMMTVVLVAVIFLLASLTSAVYLRRTSVYSLLQGEKPGKSVKHPLLWLLVTLISLAGILMGLSFIGREAEQNIIHGEPFDQVLNACLLLAGLIILFHIGFSRSLIYVLLKQKRLCAKGTNTFVFRSLSGALASNSLMLGCLAFLLTFAVAGINISFLQRLGQETELDRSYPYDVWYTGEINGRTGIPVKQAEQIIEAYAEIENRFTYSLYRWDEDVFRQQTQWSSYEGMADTYLKVSDFNRLITPLGYAPVELSDEYLIISNIPEAKSDDWVGVVYSHNGKTYVQKEICTNYPVFTYQYFYLVVPDEVVGDMEVEVKYTVYDLAEGKLDALALRKELSYTDADGFGGDGREHCDYRLREYGRQEQNSSNAVLVIGALFVAAVFLFLAMAILALKTLVGLDSDRRRYEILFHLGLGEREQGRTLFGQTFGFFMIPFVMPILMSIPVAGICRRVVMASRMAELAGQIPVIVTVTTVVVAVVYFLYYVATYRIAKGIVVMRER